MNPSKYPALKPSHSTTALKHGFNAIRAVAIKRRHTLNRVAAPETPQILDSGLDYLSDAAKAKATDPKANKFEKVKAAKCGSKMWTEVTELAALIREGKTSWDALELDDIDIRMKFAGLFHRRKRTPGKFMMRVKAPNGELNAQQLRVLANCIKPYGEDGCADITTRAGVQLRGVVLEDADKIVSDLLANDLTSFQTGMDSVRNLTGNPIAGIDPHEVIDTRPLLREMQDMLFNKGLGRTEFANLPRKINVCISSTRDDFPHTHINDVGFEATHDPDSGNVVFNVVVGGYFSVKRNTVSIPMDTCVTQEQLIPFTEALMRVFRDYGPRKDRQKARLMWLVEEVGVDKFRDLIGEYMGGVKLRHAVPMHHEGEWPRRNLLGVHPQKQEGYSWVGANVPVGRIYAADLDEFARISELYGDGSVRLTCEENVLFPNIPNDKVPKMLEEPLFQKFKVFPGALEGGLVSCTGSQFCGLALIETKNRAMALVAKLEAELDLPRPVRIHWTGCPNSCGQAQVGDIGIMGAPARLNGKAVEGVKIFLGGVIGENPKLAEEFAVGIPADEEHLLPKLREILVNDFGAVARA